MSSQGFTGAVKVKSLGDFGFAAGFWGLGMSSRGFTGAVKVKSFGDFGCTAGLGGCFGFAGVDSDEFLDGSPHPPRVGFANPGDSPPRFGVSLSGRFCLAR